MARWLGRFLLWVAGLYPYVSGAIRFFLDRIIAAPGMTGDAATWWYDWLPYVRDFFAATQAEPLVWVLSFLALGLSVWLSWPAIAERIRELRGSSIEIIFDDCAPFHGQFQNTFADGVTFKYDYHFVGVRNATKNKLIESFRVRIISVNKQKNIPQLQLASTPWVMTDIEGLQTVFDLAPGELRLFQSELSALQTMRLHLGSAA